MAKHDTTKIINKVIYAGDTLIDLSADTVAQNQVLAPAYFHLPTGERVQGTCTFDADTSDATASAAEILASKTAYVNGNKITGSMPNIGVQNNDITTVAQEVVISQGYHDGSGKIKINATEQAKIVAGNIKTGVQILGVLGKYTGSEIAESKATTGSATPTTEQQVVLPSSVDSKYEYFTQFTVEAIPYTETQNASGGYTAIIAPPPSGN